MLAKTAAHGLEASVKSRFLSQKDSGNYSRISMPTQCKSTVSRVSRNNTSVCKLTTDSKGGLHPNSQWPTGIPPQMGGHRMSSGMYAPISTSKGCGTGLPHMFQYQDPVSAADVVIFEDSQQVGEGFARFVADSSVNAIRERGIFTIALTGPETSLALANISKFVHADDFAYWHVFFAAENCGTTVTNYKAALANFLQAVPVPSGQVYNAVQGVSAEKAAADLETKVKYLPAEVPRSGKFPVMDMVVLDVALNGSVAALMPNRKELAITDSCMVPVEVPAGEAKERISFSLPFINAASQVAMIACGDEKSAVVSRILECQALPGALPAQLVAPAGKLTWLLDRAAAKELDVEGWTDWKKWPRNEIPKPKKSKK